MLQSLISYKYYDSPEGHDIYKKAFVTSKYAAVSGLAFGTFDVLTYSHPKGFVNTAGRMMWYMGPLVGMATAFTVTANMAHNIRGKSDELNYFLGGVASGAIFSAWQRNMTIAVPVCFFLGAIGAIKKTAIDCNYTFLNPVNPMYKSIQSHRHDWTLVSDPAESKS